MPTMLRAPQTAPVYMGMPDVYSEEFARAADASARRSWLR